MICWTIGFHEPRDSVTLPEATLSGVTSGATEGEGLGEDAGVLAWPDAVVETWLPP